MDITDIQKKIHKDSILFFDLDGTLIDTDYANYLSYKRAIISINNNYKIIPFTSGMRFNRSLLRLIIPNLTDSEYRTIIEYKEIFYKNNLQYTTINKLGKDILDKYCNTNETVLVTNCRRERALITLNYHGVYEKFSHHFYRQTQIISNKYNKFSNAIQILNISSLLVVAFENELSEIIQAINAGIINDNIINL